MVEDYSLTETALYILVIKLTLVVYHRRYNSIRMIIIEYLQCKELP